MASKHSIESDDGSSIPNKKQKMSKDDALSKKIFETATALVEFIPTIREDIEQNHQANDQYLKTIMNWKIACNLAKGPLPWTKGDVRLLDDRLPDDNFHSYNEKFNFFSDLQKAKLCRLPSPSEFGKDWSQYVSVFEDRVLCCRPPNARGLPLRILHHAFRQYCLDIQKPLPQASETAIAAMNAAKRLCASMGNSFSTKSDSSVAQQARDQKEDARIRQFDECIRGILDYQKSVTLKANCELSSGVVDGALLVKDVLLSMREMKEEPGASGDPYMQVVRSYDLGTKVQREHKNPTVRAFVAYGAPTFLLCVNGPNLTVAGGFCDGDKVIVEPLGDTNIMFNDYTDERRDKLARVLYALAMGIHEIKKSIDQGFPSSHTALPPFTPRIYGSCILYNPTSPARLVFTAKLESPDSNRMLFTGSLSGFSFAGPTTPVLVKLVNGGYGMEVHHLLAERSLAPTLHAYSKVEGAPTAYIMEYLDPSSWKPLSGVSLHPDSAALIQAEIEKVLKILQKNGAVHGDLRSPNIMVNVSLTGDIILVEDELGEMRANIRVVDFDWAGDAGQVSYPLSRNPDIAGVWPGKPGGTIKKDHDRKLFMSWWSNIISAWR